MSITVNWAAVPNTTGYVLYRNAGAPVNLASPPTDKVDVASDATSYVYNTGANNTVYYIVIGAKKADGTITYSDQIPVGYFPDMGPGPSNLLRGDWSYGYFGEVSATELFTGPEIYQTLYNLFGGSSINPNSNPVIATYHKCIVAGRIVFFPDNVYSASLITAAIMISNKVIVTDGDYVNKGILMAKNGNEYVLRAPHGAATAITTPANDFSNVWLSEVGMMFGLFGNNSAAVPPTPGGTGYTKYKLNDLAVGSWITTLWGTTPGITANTYMYTSISSNALNFGSAASARPYLVLELLF